MIWLLLVPLIKWELITLVLVPVLSIPSTTTTTSVGFASRSLEATVLGSADDSVSRESTSGGAALVIEGSRNDVGVVTIFIRLDKSVSTATTLVIVFGICYIYKDRYVLKLIQLTRNMRDDTYASILWILILVSTNVSDVIAGSSHWGGMS